MIPDRKAFIRANTRLKPVPHVPEISLHVAEESVPIWQKTEQELDTMGLPPPYWAFAWAGGQALARYVLDHPVPAALADRMMRLLRDPELRESMSRAARARYLERFTQEAADRALGSWLEGVATHLTVESTQGESRAS